MIILFAALVFGFLTGLGSGLWLRRDNASALRHQQRLEIIQAEKEKDQFLMMQEHANRKELMHL